MALIPEAFINSVVSIGVIEEEKTAWIGTGFIVGKKSISGGHYLYLVTNWHIIEKAKKSNKDRIYIRLREKETKIIKKYSLNPNSFNVSVDKNIDIAICSLDAKILQEQIDKLGFFDIDSNAFTSDEFFENGGAEGSSIYMLGFPMGLVGDYSCLPICRMGCVARIDKEELNSTKNMLLDIQNFPGNSGSPIICKGDMFSVEKTKSINKVALIGIVYSYIPYEESLINTQTERVVEIKSENSGIALANPVEFIKQLIDDCALKNGQS